MRDGCKEGKDMTEWQCWLLAVLEDHRNSLSKEIASQFEALQQSAETDSKGELGDPIGETPQHQGCAAQHGEAHHLAEAAHVTENTEEKSEVIQPMRDFSSLVGSKKVSEKHKYLDIFIAVIIICNIITMVVELEWESHKSQVSLGYSENNPLWRHAKSVFKFTEHLFNIIFVIELTVRLVLDKASFFRQSLNCYDFVLVGAASVQLYVLQPIGWSKQAGNIAILRMIRFARFVRVLKVMRMAVFADLRILINTCISSFVSLFWSMVLLFLIMIAAALLLCSFLKTDIQDPTRDLALRAWLYRHYGGPFRSSYTMFEVTLAGCWPTYFRPLIEKISPWYVVFAVTYITFVVFAIIRVITAIFLKQTLQVASSDAEAQVNEARLKTQAAAEKLKSLFHAMDVNGNGELNRAQFLKMASISDVKTMLQTFELAVHDVQGLFDLLDNGREFQML
jgi:hypothetical protein